MLDDLDLTSLPIVARVSSERPKRDSWTVLTIYDARPLRFDMPGVLHSFVAEIVGETRVPGQVRRQRRKAFTTVAKALNWDYFDHESPLFDQLRNKAIDWMEAEARRVAGGRLKGIPDTTMPGTKCVHRGVPSTVMLDETDGSYRFVPVQPREDRPAMPNLGAAICWLCPTESDAPEFVGDRIDRFCNVFGLERELVEFIVDVELGRAFVSNGHEGDTMALSRALTLAIRHIDRESFNARVR